jgi:DNA repair exonuclease SbcCD ATPase subunit
MRLNYLNTTNVKGLPDNHYNLRDVTYIQGNNRSGKSAILQAVQYAVFGRCDEIGSKGVGALIRSGQMSCSIECGGDLLVFRATISVNKKGAVSQERSCTYEGKEITEKELQKMFGGIPNTIAQFLELTGEETWRLIMPSQGGENALPEHIQRLADTLVGKLKESEFSTSGITAHMSGEADSYSRATALLEAVNASQREVRDKARAVIKALESPPEPYVGPSMGDLAIP